MKNRRKFARPAGIFLVVYFLPLGNVKVENAILEAFRLLQWYAIHHTLACVVPALSLLSLLVVCKVLGGRKTLVFSVLTVVNSCWLSVWNVRLAENQTKPLGL